MTHHPKAKAICARERTWVLSLCGVLCLVFALYIYMVISSVVQVVVRQEMDKDITEVKQHLAALQTEYMETQQSMSQEIAFQRGYVPASSKIYIHEAPDSLALSARREE